MYTSSISGLNNELVTNTRRPHLTQKQLMKTNLLHFHSWKTMPCLSGITFSLLAAAPTYHVLFHFHSWKTMPSLSGITFSLLAAAPTYHVLCPALFSFIPASMKAKINGFSISHCFILVCQALIKFKNHLYFEEKDLVDKAEKVRLSASPCSCLFWLSLPLFSK